MYYEIKEGPFQGWTYTPEGMFSPTGERWTPQDVEKWHWDRQLLRELKKKFSKPMQLGLVYE